MVERFAIANLVLVFFLMVGLGASIELHTFRGKLRAPRALGFGMFCQFVLFPLLLFAFLQVFTGIPPHFRVALTIIVTCPGGALSNMICYVFHADLPLSLAMTTVSSVAAVALIPFNTFLYLELPRYAAEPGVTGVKLDWPSIIGTCLVLLAGIATGQLARRRLGVRRRKRVELFGLVAGLSTIFVGVWRNTQSDAPLWGLPRGVYACMLCTSACALLVCMLSARTVLKLSKPSSVAIGVEVVCQNMNLALAIASLSVKDKRLVDEMLGAILAYGFIQSFFSIIPAAILWRLGWTELPPHANVGKALCHALFADTDELLYEVQKEEEAKALEMATEPGSAKSDEISVAIESDL